MEFDVVIEIPKGTRNKYEMDHKTGQIRLDRMLFTSTKSAHLRDITAVSEFDLLEIKHFFQVYKALEPGKEVEAAKWVGRQAADYEIEACRLRAIREGWSG